MLDPSLDLSLTNFPSYLSSWDYSRLSLNYILTNLDDTATFREWWLPADQYTTFRVASQCQSCHRARNQQLKIMLFIILMVRIFVIRHMMMVRLYNKVDSN